MSSGGITWFQYVSKPTLVASTSIFCGLAILCNLFIILVILLSRLRSSGKYLIILALSIVQLYDACAVWAPAAQFYSLETWIHDVKYIEYSDTSQFYIFMSFRTLLMITVCCAALVEMFSVNKRVLTLMSVSMIFASIFYSLVFVLPTTEGTPDMSSRCSAEARKTVQSASFFPPATILLVLIIDICIVSCCCTRFFDDVTSAIKRSFPSDVVVASVAFLLFSVPFEIYAMNFSSCTESGDCRRMHLARVGTVLWHFVGYFVLPLIWLLCPDLRREITHICCCRSSPAQPVNYNMQSLNSKM